MNLGWMRFSEELAAMSLQFQKVRTCAMQTCEWLVEKNARLFFTGFVAADMETGRKIVESQLNFEPTPTKSHASDTAFIRVHIWNPNTQFLVHQTPCICYWCCSKNASASSAVVPAVVAVARSLSCLQSSYLDSDLRPVRGRSVVAWKIRMISLP